MPEIRTWRDTPKGGETDGGWFYSLSRWGHVYEVKGGFPDEPSAVRAAGFCPGCRGSGQRFTCDEQEGFERNRRWEPCWDCDGTGEAPRPDPEDEERERS